MARPATNAVQELATGIYGMFAGDATGNNNIQTTDTNTAKLALGAIGYTINDMNMNGDVQTTDLNIILQLIGKSIQF